MWRFQVGSPGEVVDRAAVLVVPHGGDGPGVEGVDGADPALVRAARRDKIDGINRRHVWDKPPPVD